MSINAPEHERLRLAIAAKLDDISQLIDPKYKLTLVCRMPGNDDATIIVSDDEEYAALGAAERQLHRDGITLDPLASSTEDARK